MGYYTLTNYYRSQKLDLYIRIYKPTTLTSLCMLSGVLVLVHTISLYND